jgi:pimeloyl-ACP methyl ester carboxylesterase
MLESGRGRTRESGSEVMAIPARSGQHARAMEAGTLVRRALAVAVAASALAGPPAFAAASAARKLEETPCRLVAERLPAVLASCSRLVVQEDPGREGGPTLTLFVARVPALTATPSPDPLVLIAGGPGQSTVDLYLQLRQAFEPVRRERDIVLLDQRGTGRSADGFGCDFPSDLDVDMASPERLGTAVEQCLGELDRDPRFYSTSPAVADLDALRAALGAERWNLYGVSYGTRVAQHYARRYPDRTRSLILDGVVPAELVLGPAIALDAQHALNAVVARCAADTACGSRFPELGNRFDALRRRLAEGPVAVDAPDPLTGESKSYAFTEAELVGVVRLMSYSAPTVALLPLAIDTAYEGDYRMLAAEADVLLGSTQQALNIPMHNSVVCSEDVPFFPADPPAELDASYLGSSIVDSLRAICRVWPTGVMDEDFKEPVEFAGPVLLLSGEDDPVTPPEYAERAMAHGLENAVHLVAPGQGHGMAGVGCVPRLMARFIETADPAAVDGSCLADEPPTPFFLSTLGPGA